jgi:diguanylate cyclase (GGDEF)-like protein/PAS domain S-box-containing protein
MNTAFVRLRRIWTGSIRRRLVLGVGGLIAATMAAFVYQTVERQQDFLGRQSEESSVALAETLAVNSVSWVLANDTMGLAEVVSSARRYPDLGYVMVLAPDGKVLAHSDAREVGRYVGDSPSLMLLAGPKKAQVVARTPSLIDVAAPIESQGAPIGWARVGVGQDRLDESLRDITRRGIYYAATAIAVGALLATWGARSLTRGLTQLVELTSKVGAGNAAVRAAVKRDDELGALNNSFDAMAAALEKSGWELRESERELRQLMANLPTAVLVYGPDAAIRYNNEAASDILGLTEEQMLNKPSSDPCWRFIREDGSAMPVEEFPVSRVIADRKPLRDYMVGYARVQGADPQWVLVNSFPDMDAAGALRHVIVSFVDITKRRRMEETLSRNEAQLKDAQRLAHVGSWELDIVRNTFAGSDELSRIFEFDLSRLDAPCEALRDAVHPEDREFVNQAHIDSAERKVPCDTVHRLLMKDGRVKYVNARCETFYDDDGEPLRLIGMVHDITEQQCTELALAESEIKYHSLYNNTPAMMHSIDANDNLLSVSNAWLESLGYEREEVIGRKSVEFMTPESQNHAKEKVLPEFFKTGACKDVSYQFLKKNGELMDVLFSATSEKNALSTVACSLSVLVDVTERKRAEEALRESEAKLREAQEIAQVGSWEWCIASDTHRWSDELSRILGRDQTAPEPRLSEFLTYVHPDDRKRMTDTITSASKTGKPFHVECRITRLDGEERIIEARGRGYLGEDSSPVRMAVAIHDITGRKRIEHRLEAASLYARSLFEANVDPLITININGEIIDINEATVRVSGTRRENLVSSNISNFFTDPQIIRAALREVLCKGSVSDLQLTVCDHSSGKLTELLCNAAVFRGPDGIVNGVFVAARDVTERHHREEELVKLHERMAETVAELRQRERDITLVDELNEILQTCNTRDEAYRLIALAAQELFPTASGALAVFVGGACDLTTVAHWGDKPNMASDFGLDDCWALRRGHVHQIDQPAKGAVCGHFDASPMKPYICLPLSIHGEALGLLHLSADVAYDEKSRRLAIMLGDVIKLSLSNLKLRDTLRNQAIRDSLTGMFNRQYLSETLPREVSRTRRSEAPLSVAMLDIDHFKIFNDKHGHDAGDYVLKEVGSVLSKAVRGSDIVCRYGGEEFLFVLVDCDLKASEERLAQVCQQIKEKKYIFHGNVLPCITVSVGLSQFSEEMASEAELITTADHALYEAKNSGRDRIAIFTPIESK